MSIHDDEQFAAQAIEIGDYEEALRLLLPLSERDSEYALHLLGWIYDTGAVGLPDRDSARSYYKRAVAKGGVSACHDLGELLFDQGEEAQARSVFEVGAERGDMLSMSTLGWMMVKGRGGPADIGAASVWLQAAAATGNIFARRTLIGIELVKPKSIFRTLKLYIDIILLVKEGVGDLWKDPHSDKVR